MVGKSAFYLDVIPRIFLCHLFYKLNLVIFSTKVNRYLLGHLLLQFYADSCETLQVVRSYSEDMQLFGYNPQIFALFYKTNLISHFSGIITLKVKC